jgi:hypothetical protein
MHEARNNQAAIRGEWAKHHPSFSWTRYFSGHAALRRRAPIAQRARAP